ncbi:MAG: surfactin synthase thioesterase subunit/NADPH:quinone reductase-like Zn-dependent oxidoreductase, partial [Flavobacteriales bacterium]
SGILEDHKQTVIQVSASSDYTKIADNEFHISPEDSDHYQKLIDDIVRSGFKIDHVVHSFAFDSDFDPSFNADDIMALQTQGFGSIVYYLQAQNTLEEKPSSFTLITCNAFDCENAKELNFEQSHLVGLTRVMGNEMPELLVKCVDIDVSLTSQEKDNLFVELNGSTLDEEVSIRGSSRFVRRLMRWQPENEVAEIIGDTQSFAMSFKETGDVDSLQYTPVPISLPKANEVAIKVSYAALNFKDVLKASGLFPTDLMEENLWSGDSLGMECSGTVTACGSDVKDIAVGTRVMALAPNSLRSDTTTHASLVVPITNLSDEQAAAMPMVFLTAYYGLIELARLKKGERVLIHAAAGGVGQAAIQLAQWVGAEIYATCGSESKRDFLKNLGVHNIYDSRSSSFAKDILNDTDGQGVDVVLNSLAGSLIDLGLSLLRDYGRFVEIGKMDINRDKGIGLKPFHYNLSFFAVDLDRMLEQRPEDCGAMLNALDELIRAGKIKPIKTTCFSTGTASEAFKTMLSGEHMGKLVVSFNDDAGVKMARSESPVFDHKSNYLITGGLGGFGSSLAHWLVDHGARHLTLLGRSGAHSPSAKRLVSELEGRGTKVTVIPADVSDRKHVEKIRNAMDEKYPLKGIFHAAGILDDALLLKQDMDKFNRVAATKISGSWNLHTLSKSFDLDYFVMFSSVATSLGNQGSGNYAAANAFMDGLSHFRKQHGLSALSVNWGVIADVGMAADEDFYRRSLEENGLRALHSRDGLDLMGLMLLEKETQITVSPVDWEKWLRFNPAGGKTRYSELVLAQAKGQSSSQSVEEKSMREKLSSVEKGEIRAVATEEVQQVLAKLFGFDAKKILPEKSLTNLGMDSLMAVELKVRLDRFGVAIPVATLLRDMNVNKIVNTMLAHFELANEESSNKNDLESPLKGEWLVVHEPRPKAKYRMFCFPYAGAGPVVYQNWQEQLSSEIEVVSIHLPGRGSRLDEHAMTQISMMSTAIVNAMQDKLDKPIIFFGHCMGAIVMSEVAAQLKESNSIDADHIFVSGCMAPHLYNSPLVYGLEQKKFIDVLDLISFTSASAMHKGKEIVELMTPMLRADFEAVAHYFETKTKVIKFSSPITGFAAKHDLFAAPSAMRAWERYSEGKFKLNMLDGDHYFIESDQDIIIESINRTLGFSANTEIDMDRFENVESIGYDKREKCIEYGVIKQTPLGAINKDILYWVDGYSPEKNTLFCFPGAWENRTIPEYIPQDIGDDWQVAVVQYPGHGMRESEGCCLEIKPIIVELASALFNYIDKPFAFLGHCVGGLIQYEVAKLFKSQAHTEPQFMLVSAVVNPEIYTAPNGHLLDDSKLLELLDVIDCPLMDLLRNEGDNTKLLSLVRSDLELMANYVSSKPIVFDCPITVITGRNDLWTYPLQANSWHRLTSAQENVVHVHEGTHYLNKTSQQLFLKSIQRLIKIGDLHELLVSE